MHSKIILFVLGRLRIGFQPKSEVKSNQIRAQATIGRVRNHVRRLGRRSLAGQGETRLCQVDHSSYGKILVRVQRKLPYDEIS